MTNRCLVCSKLRDPSVNRALHKFPSDMHRRNAWIQSLSLDKEMLNARYLYICSEHFEENYFNIRPGGTRMLKYGAIPTITLSKEPEKFSSTLTSHSSLRDRISPILTESRKIRIKAISSMANASSSTITASDMAPVIPIMEKTSSETDSASEIDEKNIAVDSSSETLTASETGDAFEAVSPSPQPKRKRRKYIHDITIDDLQTLKRAKRVFVAMKTKVMEQKRRIKFLVQENQRLNHEVQNMKSVIAYFKEKHYTTDSAESTNQIYGISPLCLVQLGTP